MAIRHTACVRNRTRPPAGPRVLQIAFVFALAHAASGAVAFGGWFNTSGSPSAVAGRCIAAAGVEFAFRFDNFAGDEGTAAARSRRLNPYEIYKTRQPQVRGLALLLCSRSDYRLPGKFGL